MPRGALAARGGGSPPLGRRRLTAGAGGRNRVLRWRRPRGRQVVMYDSPASNEVYCWILARSARSSPAAGCCLT
jgi:hypothetical protein